MSLKLSIKSQASSLENWDSRYIYRHGVCTCLLYLTKNIGYKKNKQRTEKTNIIKVLKNVAIISFHWAPLQKKSILLYFFFFYKGTKKLRKIKESKEHLFVFLSKELWFWTNATQSDKFKIIKTAQEEHINTAAGNNETSRQKQKARVYLWIELSWGPLDIFPKRHFSGWCLWRQPAAADRIEPPRLS